MQKLTRHERAALIAAWDERLRAEGLPPEPKPIRRRRLRKVDIHTHWESDIDRGMLDEPPPLPAVHRRGRVPAYDVVSARENAFDLLHNGDLSGHELEVWALYCAGLSERRIAAKYGTTKEILGTDTLNSLKLRAGIPVTGKWNPTSKPRPHRRGLKYRVKPKSTGDK